MIGKHFELNNEKNIKSETNSLWLKLIWNIIKFNWIKLFGKDFLILKW